MIDAARVGDLEEVRALIDKGAGVNAKRDNGKTALMESAQRGHLKIVNSLLDTGDPA